ncbi:unnamed protein product [Strongylus vulgaris]|uniref:G-protein coupled receptors family 1 profile domain-containing protein n=1 Tax=Strongylus vulgaris TaxID=40348 RepID=A0A3P7KVC6_STRVU|nr:unnamed protein product [Strongylus vulgaris]
MTSGKPFLKDEYFKTAIGISVIFLAMLGILTNILVLILSFCHVTGDFGNLVANLAVVDIACGFVFAFMGFINVEDNKKHFSFGLMTYILLAFYGSFGVMVCALVPISLSRVIALTKPHLSIWLFSGRRSLLVCVLFDLAPIALLFMVDIQLHISQMIMTVGRQERARWLYFYAGLTVLSYIVAFLSNYMVFRIVARHIRVVQNLRDHVRLLETRQIALATFAQAIVPLICQPLRETVIGVAKQTGYAAAGTAAGGLLMGPLGALAGGVVGAVYGYQCSTDYDNLICSIRSMTDREKTLLSGQIQRLVGSVSIEEFIRYISTEAHRELLLGILSDFVRQKTS